MSETGAVKFSYEQVAVAPVEFAGLEEMNACRRKLMQLGWLGVESNGIGFGNLSVRIGRTNRFFITGSGTGGFAQLAPEQFAEVIEYDFQRNWLHCAGETVASSESLTHAAVYEADASVSAVIHCHSATGWKRLLGRWPTTDPDVEYGTPEMARAVMRLFQTTDVKERRLFVMAGHEGGIVAFGKDCNEAFPVLLSAMNASSSRGRRSAPRDLAQGP
ncbi:MAG: class II aldolase/adducin family protein [Chthoniobacterales bacterium]|nr:class II aldolase/adducin family protein [Chthoniobacterales bacterium]